MRSAILSAIILLISIIIGAVIISSATRSPGSPGKAANNVYIKDGKQIIEITAKGGYWPRDSLGKADVPTIIRFKTKGTFDCSSAVRIPDLDITRNLPPSGNTDIDIGIPRSGVLSGMCGMGMYQFRIEFKS